MGMNNRVAFEKQLFLVEKLYFFAFKMPQAVAWEIDRIEPFGCISKGLYAVFRLLRQQKWLQAYYIFLSFAIGSELFHHRSEKLFVIGNCFVKNNIQIFDVVEIDGQIRTMCHCF